MNEQEYRQHIRIAFDETFRLIWRAVLPVIIVWGVISLFTTYGILPLVIAVELGADAVRFVREFFPIIVVFALIVGAYFYFRGFFGRLYGTSEAPLHPWNEWRRPRD